MEKVHVNASKSYSVLIESGLLQRCGDLIKEKAHSDIAVIVTDDTVASLYLETLAKAIQQTGMQTLCFTIQHGEQSKNAENYIKLLNFLAENHINRKDLLIALGGGVVGDLTGFAAATYLRGIPFIQIPTTLLACVDSSVGGKTGIDLDCGKNLAGAFYQPEMVLCDPNLLRTLDEDNFRSGMAEVIKYAILCDKTFFDDLKSGNLDMTSVIARCVQIKSDLVAKDEFDTGLRQLLNFGHTIGHAIEAASHFRILHGIAVASGMGLITKIAYLNHLCDQKTVDSVYALLNQFHLPHTTDIPYTLIQDKLFSDKKILAKRINLIIPREIGKCEIYPIEVSALSDFMRKGFEG